MTDPPPGGGPQSAERIAASGRSAGRPGCTAPEVSAVGSEAGRALAAIREAVLALGDQLGWWIALVDHRGVLRHASRALGQALRDAPADAGALRAAIVAAAITSAAPRAYGPRARRAPSRRELAGESVPFGGRHVRVFALPSTDGLAWLQRDTIVAIECLTERTPDPAARWARYRFTPREAEVARLIASGVSARRIASRLGMSPHTARRHIERIEGKLDAHSRAEAAVKLLGTHPA